MYTRSEYFTTRNCVFNVNFLAPVVSEIIGVPKFTLKGASEVPEAQRPRRRRRRWDRCGEGYPPLHAIKGLEERCELPRKTNLVYFDAPRRPLIGKAS